QGFGDVPGQVGLGQNPGTTSVVTFHHQAAHLIVLHHLDGFLQVGVWGNRHDFAGHGIDDAHQERVLPTGDDSRDDVSVCDDAYGLRRAIGFDDRDGTAVTIDHELRYLLDVRGGLT